MNQGHNVKSKAIKNPQEEKEYETNLQTSCRIADGKKAELSRHKTDMSAGEHEKNTAEKAKVKSN